VLNKNICDGVGVQDESIGTPLYPPLFWLDNIFKAMKQNNSLTYNIVQSMKRFYRFKNHHLKTDEAIASLLKFVKKFS
jgi:hypothetical protein